MNKKTRNALLYFLILSIIFTFFSKTVIALYSLAVFAHISYSYETELYALNTICSCLVESRCEHCRKDLEEYVHGRRN